MDMKELLDRAEYTIEYQKQEIDRLRQELAGLRAEGGAHAALRSVYNSPQASETSKIRAAAAAIGYEQPKLSVVGYVGQRDRKEAWRVYDSWSLRREIMMKIKDVPPPGWDAHLQRDTYVEPPESEGMPPVDVIEDPVSGYKVLSNLLPKSGQFRRLGNGNGDDSDD